MVYDDKNYSPMPEAADLSTLLKISTNRKLNATKNITVFFFKVILLNNLLKK